jgi:hypothetical protein
MAGSVRWGYGSGSIHTWAPSILIFPGRILPFSVFSDARGTQPKRCTQFGAGHQCLHPFSRNVRLPCWARVRFEVF